jgi:hypothetical protein
MGIREKIFIDEASDLLDELEELIKDMREDGICTTEDIRRIANELDETWKELDNEDDDFNEDEDLEEGENETAPAS